MKLSKINQDIEKTSCTKSILLVFFPILMAKLDPTFSAFLTPSNYAK